MKTRFNPFPPLSGKYGAPMGRATTRREFPESADLCVSHPQGEYDSGGAYWGIGYTDGPVFAVWERGNSQAGIAYVRAKSPDGARQAAR